MPKVTALPTQAWDVLEGVVTYTFYTIAAIVLSRYGIEHLPRFIQLFLFANLPGLLMLAISLLRERLENRRWQ
jgi:hypothetical protein